MMKNHIARTLALFLILAAGMLYSQNITVTAPNGGEDLEMGSAFRITWTERGLSGGHIVVQLYQGSTQVGHISYNVPLGTRFVNWEVGRLAHGSVPPGDNYRIRVRLYDSPTWDYSDSAFTISEAGGSIPDPERSLRVTAPNGGEGWGRGRQQNISWHTSGISSGTYKITLYDGSSAVGVVAEHIPHPTTTYRWPVGTYRGGEAPYGSNYKIKVELTGESLEDLSDRPFRIVRMVTLDDNTMTLNPPQMGDSTPVIRVVAPNGGESIRRVENFTVVWEAVEGFGTPRIKLMDGGRVVKEYPPDRVFTLRSGDTYRWTWVLSSDIPAGRNYKLRIEKSDFSRSRDESDGTFVITGGGDLSVVEPRGGGLTITNRKMIDWRASGLSGNLTISLKEVGSDRENVIARNVPVNPTRYLWHAGHLHGTYAPLISESSRYKIVLATTDGSVRAESNELSFHRPTLTLRSPNGGTYHRGDNLPIRWTASPGFHGDVVVILQRRSGSSVFDFETLYTGHRRSIDWTIWPPVRGGEVDPPPVDCQYRVMIKSTRCPRQIHSAIGEWFTLRD